MVYEKCSPKVVLPPRARFCYEHVHFACSGGLCNRRCSRLSINPRPSHPPLLVFPFFRHGPSLGVFFLGALMVLQWEVLTSCCRYLHDLRTRRRFPFFLGAVSTSWRGEAYRHSPSETKPSCPPLGSYFSCCCCCCCCVLSKPFRQPGILCFPGVCVNQLRLFHYLSCSFKRKCASWCFQYAYM